MPWIEPDEDLAHHPKTLLASRHLARPVPQIIGHLYILAQWCLLHSGGGHLTYISPTVIADACMWDGDAQFLKNKLVETGWLVEENEGGVSASDLLLQMAEKGANSSQTTWGFPPELLNE